MEVGIIAQPTAPSAGTKRKVSSFANENLPPAKKKVTSFANENLKPAAKNVEVISLRQLPVSTAPSTRRSSVSSRTSLNAPLAVISPNIPAAPVAEAPKPIPTSKIPTLAKSKTTSSLVSAPSSASVPSASSVSAPAPAPALVPSSAPAPVKNVTFAADERPIRPSASANMFASLELSATDVVAPTSSASLSSSAPALSSRSSRTAAPAPRAASSKPTSQTSSTASSSSLSAPAPVSAPAPAPAPLPASAPSPVSAPFSAPVLVSAPVIVKKSLVAPPSIRFSQYYPDIVAIKKSVTDENLQCDALIQSIWTATMKDVESQLASAKSSSSSSSSVSPHAYIFKILSAVGEQYKKEVAQRKDLQVDIIKPSSACVSSRDSRPVGARRLSQADVEDTIRRTNEAVQLLCVQVSAAEQCVKQTSWTLSHIEQEQKQLTQLTSAAVMEPFSFAANAKSLIKNLTAH